jgi:hypothetical protein
MGKKINIALIGLIVWSVAFVAVGVTAVVTVGAALVKAANYLQARLLYLIGLFGFFLQEFYFVCPRLILFFTSLAKRLLPDRTLRHWRRQRLYASATYIY